VRSRGELLRRVLLRGALILAETGNATGAIQIAATDADTQIPFFITSCDYTLMGEELYAASAYLSRHPTLLAQLKGQDIGKAIMTVLLILATIAVTIGGSGTRRSVTGVEVVCDVRRRERRAGRIACPTRGLSRQAGCLPYARV